VEDVEDVKDGRNVEVEGFVFVVVVDKGYFRK
jgi:hypothetical protein